MLRARVRILEREVARRSIEVMTQACAFCTLGADPIACAAGIRASVSASP